MDSSGNEETQSQYEREYLKYKETEEEKKPKKTQQIQTPLLVENEEADLIRLSTFFVVIIVKSIKII